jgi:hypothetical protein
MQHGGSCTNTRYYRVLGCDAMQFGRSSLMFCRTVPRPTSVAKSNLTLEQCSLWRHIPEDSNHQSYSDGNLRSQNVSWGAAHARVGQKGTYPAMSEVTELWTEDLCRRKSSCNII